MFKFKSSFFYVLSVASVFLCISCQPTKQSYNPLSSTPSIEKSSHTSRLDIDTHEQEDISSSNNGTESVSQSSIENKIEETPKSEAEGTVDTYAYTYNEAGGFEERNADDMITLSSWASKASGECNYITPHSDIKDVSFEMKTYAGNLAYRNSISLNFVKPCEIYEASNGESVMWQEIGAHFLEKTYIDVIAKTKDGIIGYSVIEVRGRKNPSGSTLLYNPIARVIKSSYTKGVIEDSDVSKAIDDIKKKELMGRIYSCDMSSSVYDDNTGTYEIEIDDLFDLSVSEDRLYGSSKQVLYKTFGFSYSDFESSFICKATEGVVSFDYSRNPSYEQLFYGETAYWTRNDSASKRDPSEPISAFIEVTIETNNNIVGYGVLSVNSINEGNIEFDFVKSSIFPAVSGKKQAITQETVDSLMKKVESAYQEKQ